MKVIVNADDYGRDENATKAIAECFANGELTSTTAMVTSPYIGEAIAIAKRGEFFDRIGLHVNLVEGFPLTEEIKNCPLFCDETGAFNAAFIHRKLTRLLLPKRVRDIAGLEIRAQMSKFVSLGFPLRHYDSHCHSCTALSLLDAALDAALDYGFKSTRIYINTSGNSTGGELSWLRRQYCRCVSSRIGLKGMIHTDYLGYTWDITRWIDRIPDTATFEVLCHPDYRAPDKTYDMNGKLMDWKTPWEVTHANMQSINGKITLVSFADLYNGNK